MRRSLPILFALALLAPLAAHAFEGQVTYELRSSGNQTHRFNYQVKGDKLRIETQTDRGHGTMLMLPAEKAMYVLVDERKLAMKHSLAPPTAKGAKAGRKTEFHRTNRKETVAGQECTVYEYKTDENQGEVCSAEGMGTFYFGNGGAQAPAWVDEARSKGMFPLRVEDKDKTGKTTELVATDIKKTSLPDSLFEIPAGYQVMEGVGGPAAGAGGPHAGAAPAPNDLMKRMMSASPEERARIAAEMQKQYGAPKK